MIGDFAETVARLCYDKFKSLPRKGKPIPGEQWTTLAAILELDGDCLQIVSLATGSKCIGKSKMNSSGTVVHDSHSEVLARRGLLLYLYDQISFAKSSEKPSNVCTANNGKFKINRSLSYHLFTSQVPCGDAAIFPLTECDPTSSDLVGPVAKKAKLLQWRENEKIKLPAPNDIHRTGAKCLRNDHIQDSKLPGVDYHVTGAVRTKPGRGDPTLSMSCSDKILRWNHVGIEGALLSVYLSEPLYLSRIVIACEKKLFDEEAAKRALMDRTPALVRDASNESKPYPTILHTESIFDFSRRIGDEGRALKPAPASIMWCNIGGKNHEVIVDGLRLGQTKKKKSSYNPIIVSKRNLLRCFKEIDPMNADLTYLEAKELASKYREKTRHFKQSLGNWVEKDVELLNFK